MRLKGKVAAVTGAAQGIDLRAYFVIGQAAARQMVAQVKAVGPMGSIVDMSSVQEHSGLPDHVAYSVAKGGVRKMPLHAVISDTVFERMKTSIPVYAPQSLFDLDDALDARRQKFAAFGPGRSGVQ